MPRGHQLTDETAPTTPSPVRNGRPASKQSVTQRSEAKASQLPARVDKAPKAPRKRNRWLKGKILWILLGVWRLLVGSSTPRNQAPAQEVVVTPTTAKPQRFSWLRLLVKKPKLKKEKKRRRPRQTISGSLVKVTLFVLIFAIYPFIMQRGVRALSKVKNETQARIVADNRTEGQLKVLGTSSNFPIADAEAKAYTLAYDCFTVPNVGNGKSNDDSLTLQTKALTNDATPASDSINCGWNGKGRGKVDGLQVVSVPYWIHDDYATIIYKVKLYQRPGSFYYYVPFKNNNGVAQYAGMPAIFGTASGALDFMRSCPNPANSVDTGPLQHTAQLFLDALAGDSSVDLGYLVYGDHGDTKFGGFGPVVSTPTVTQVKYCGTKGNERQFAAMVQFSGPVAGALYTLPYAFGVVPNPETSGKYQVKDFGPIPGYHGS
jgi:hypothetical protein